MITKEDIEFIDTSFKYALMRMEELGVENWGDHDTKQQRIIETKQQQFEILEKLRKMQE